MRLDWDARVLLFMLAEYLHHCILMFGRYTLGCFFLPDSGWELLQEPLTPDLGYGLGCLAMKS